MFFHNYVNQCNKKGLSPSAAAEAMGFKRSMITRWSKGSEPRQATLQRMADFFECDIEELTKETEKATAEPTVTDNYVIFNIIGEVAAGYDHVAYEELSEDTIEIPISYLRGRTREDYFVLRITGDSMFPQYQDGDIVLVLKQSTMNHSGEIGVVVYDDDKATLKRVEYVAGEDWMKLSPINPMYPPIVVRDEKLEHCRVLGIPKMLIRYLGD